MKMLIAKRWIACLCALPWLAGCGLLRTKPSPPPVPTTEVVRVPELAYVPLPRALTDPIAPPPAPAVLCTDAAGQPAVCVIDALATIPQWRDALDTCNSDRARAAVLGSSDGQR